MSGSSGCTGSGTRGPTTQCPTCGGFTPATYRESVPIVTSPKNSTPEPSAVKLLLSDVLYGSFQILFVLGGIALVLGAFYIFVLQGMLLVLSECGIALFFLIALGLGEASRKKKELALAQKENARLFKDASVYIEDPTTPR